MVPHALLTLSIALHKPMPPALNNPACLFTALSTALCYTNYAGDTCDAFAHSPAPRVSTFLRINDAFAEWYEQRFHKPVDRNHVLPIQHALQGHPESARLWDEYITGILQAIGLKTPSTSVISTLLISMAR